MKKFILAFFLIVSFSLGFIFFSRPPVLQDFKHNADKSEIQMTFKGGLFFYYAKFFEKIPTSLSIDNITWSEQDQSLGMGYSLQVSEKEIERTGEYSVVIYALPMVCGWNPELGRKLDLFGGCKSLGALEIVRQPSQWLLKNFNWQAPMGHSILGRRNLRVKEKAAPPLSNLEFIGPAKIPLAFVKEAQNRHKDWPLELVQASAAMNYLWSKKIHVGPMKKSYGTFLNETIDSKLDCVESGECAIQCQGLRDLFLHLMADEKSRVKARAVEAYNYYPPLKELQTYGHSTSEIFLSTEGRFILADPWAGFALKAKGKWVSAEDISSGKVKASEIEIVELVDKTKRLYLGKNSQIRSDISTPSSMSMSDHSFKDLVHIPGYFVYFGNIRYRPGLIKK